MVKYPARVAVAESLRGWHVVELVAAGILVSIASVLLASGAELSSLSRGGLSVSALVSVISFAILCVVFALRALFDGPRQVLAHRPMFVLVLIVFLMWVGVSAAFNPTVEAAQSFIVASILCLGTIFFAQRIPQNWALRFHKVLGFAGLLGVLVFLGNMVFSGALSQPAATWFDHAAFGMVMVLALCFALARAMFDPVWWIPSLVVFVAIVLSTARINVFAAFFAVGIVFFTQRRSLMRMIVNAGLAWMLAALVFLIIAVLRPHSAERFKLDFSALDLGSPDGLVPPAVEQANHFSSGRFAAWGEFLALPVNFFDWVFGLGAGATSRHARENIPNFENTLNEYLRIGLDYGALGLFLFLLALVLLILKLWDNRTNVLAKTGFLALVVSGIVAITDGQFLYPFTVIPLAVILGLALGPGGRVAHWEELSHNDGSSSRGFW